MEAKDTAPCEWKSVSSNILWASCLVIVFSTSKFSDPDVLIRTGGYNRLSDFFLYQCSFTELYFTKTLWPDLNKTYLNRIINKFSKLERKFGK